MQLYKEIAGGTSYKVELSKDNESVSNEEVRLVCKTSGGAINIELPSLVAYKNAIGLKIFIDDADDMAGRNPITITTNKAQREEVMAIIGMAKDRQNGLKISTLEQNRVALTDSKLAVSGFPLNDGLHDLTGFVRDQKSDSLFSDTLKYQDQVPSDAKVKFDSIIPNTINNSDSYVINRNGGKIEIFVSSINEFGVIDGEVEVKSYALIGTFDFNDLNKASEKDFFEAKASGKYFDGLLLKTVEAFIGLKGEPLGDVALTLNALDGGVNILNRQAKSFVSAGLKVGVQQYLEAQTLKLAVVFEGPNPKDWTKGKFEVYGLLRDFPALTV